MVDINKWTKGKRGNLRLYNEDYDFYISYQPSPPDTGIEETAICARCNDSFFGTKYLILQGDFREDYEILYEQGLEACVAFYNANKEKDGLDLKKETTTLDV